MGPPMLGITPFRDATSVFVEADPSDVQALLRHPNVLRLLDDRIPEDTPLDIVERAGRIEIRDLDGHVHFAFRTEAEGSGTRLAALETVRPTSAREVGKHMLFPGRHHQELRTEMDRLKGLLEALGER